jgi:DNA-binding transcriptional ArsR family regulator
MSTAASSKKERQLDAVFHALADSTRRQIVRGLSRGSASVSELAEPFDMSLPAVSKHLAVLERAGLVRRERDGRFQRCRLLAAPLDDASEFIEHYRSFWQHNLERLAQFVEGAATPAPPRKKSRKEQ